ncbi:hypothetical protein J1614_007365, partial [Plenodomus biglobosus]
DMSLLEDVNDEEDEELDLGWNNPVGGSDKASSSWSTVELLLQRRCGARRTRTQVASNAMSQSLERQRLWSPATAHCDTGKDGIDGGHRVRCTDKEGPLQERTTPEDASTPMADSRATQPGSFVATVCWAQNRATAGSAHAAVSSMRRGGGAMGRSRRTIRASAPWPSCAADNRHRHGHYHRRLRRLCRRRQSSISVLFTNLSNAVCAVCSPACNLACAAIALGASNASHDSVFEKCRNEI